MYVWVGGSALALYRCSQLRVQNAADRVGCVSAQRRLPLPLEATGAACRSRPSARTLLSTRVRRVASDAQAESEECVYVVLYKERERERDLQRVPRVKVSVITDMLYIIIYNTRSFTIMSE